MCRNEGGCKRPHISGIELLAPKPATSQGGMSQTLTNNPISLTKLMKRDEKLMVKMVVGVLRDSKYYDHRLTRIEKGKLIDNLNGLAKAVVVYEPSRSQEGVISDASRDKDTKLVSLLQVGDVSKVVDENGDPSECICELDATLWSLTWSMSGTVVICRGTHRRG